MIEVNAIKNQLTITEREQITSGSVNVYYVHFHFSSHWDDLEKVAVFRTPSTTINIPIVDNKCVIPWEVTTTPGISIQLGVYGVKALEIVLPTIWTNLGMVLEGVIIGDAESGDHTPDIYDAILENIDSLRNDVNAIADDIPTDDGIRAIIEEYLRDNPPSIGNNVIEMAIQNYFKLNPIKTLTREDVQQMIDDSVGAAIADGY